MKSVSVKTNEGLVIDFHLNDPYKFSRNPRSVVLTYGIFGRPPSYDNPAVRALVDEEFLVAVPHYFGTFDSCGYFDERSAVQSVSIAADYISKIRRIPLWGNGDHMLEWAAHQPYAAGASGGAMILAEAAQQGEFANLAFIGCPSRFALLARNGYLKNYSDNRRIVYSRTWRFDPEDSFLARFSAGEIGLDSLQCMSNLRGTPVLVAYNNGDRVVPETHAQDLIRQLESAKANYQAVACEGTDHPGVELLAHPEVFTKFLEQVRP